MSKILIFELIVRPNVVLTWELLSKPFLFVVSVFIELTKCENFNLLLIKYLLWLKKRLKHVFVLTVQRNIGINWQLLYKYELKTKIG